MSDLPKAFQSLLDDTKRMCEPSDEEVANILVLGLERPLSEEEKASLDAWIEVKRAEQSAED